MSKQQTFNRKEVAALLKKQVERSVRGYNSVSPNQFLALGVYSDQYWDECKQTTQRLKNQTLIKF